MNTSPSELRNYSVQDHLSDGRPVLVRAIQPGDKAALQDGLHRLSADSVYSRFFSPKHQLSPDELVYFTEVDFVDHVALVAGVSEGGEDVFVGVGRYIVGQDESVRAAEVAFAVDDAHHRMGIATLLLRHLTEIARDSGIVELRASVLAENRSMLGVFSHSGLTQTRARDGHVVEITFPLSRQKPYVSR
jgi:GNAT superfamily N-acetyltransferase